MGRAEQREAKRVNREAFIARQWARAADLMGVTLKVV